MKTKMPKPITKTQPHSFLKALSHFTFSGKVAFKPRPHRREVVSQAVNRKKSGVHWKRQQQQQQE